MSTKIYDAFRIKANSLDEVISQFFIEKEKITQELECELIKDILIESINLYDKFSLDGDNLLFKKGEGEKNTLDYSKSVKSILFDKFWDSKRNKDKDEIESNYKEVEAQMIIYPQPIDCFGEKSYLMQWFGESKLTSVMEKHLTKWNVKEYNYWNNTDPPDTVTDYEWNLRKTHWKGIDIPIFNGISITFIKSTKYEVFYLYDTNSKKKYIEKVLEDLNKTMSLDKRVQKQINKIKESHAYKYYYDIAIKENNLENAEKEKITDFIISKGMSIYFKARDKVQEDNFTEEEKIIFYEKEQQIKRLLKESFVFEDFSKKGEEIVKESEMKNVKKMKP